MWLYIVLGILGALLLIWFIIQFNKFIKLKNNTDKALSNMDVFFQKRHDLIPNLVESVKGYIKHESNLIEEVTLARSNAISEKKGEKKARAEYKLGNALGNLIAVAENYPDIKARQNFLDLCSRLSIMEGEIAEARQAYNQAATDFNIKRETFPDSIAAFLMGLRKRTLFKAGWKERKNIKIKF